MNSASFLMTMDLTSVMYSIGRQVWRIMNLDHCLRIPPAAILDSIREKERGKSSLLNLKRSSCLVAESMAVSLASASFSSSNSTMANSSSASWYTSSGTSASAWSGS